MDKTFVPFFCVFICLICKDIKILFFTYLLLVVSIIIHQVNENKNKLLVKKEIERYTRKINEIRSNLENNGITVIDNISTIELSYSVKTDDERLKLCRLKLETTINYKEAFNIIKNIHINSTNNNEIIRFRINFINYVAKLFEISKSKTKSQDFVLLILQQIKDNEISNDFIQNLIKIYLEYNKLNNCQSVISHDTQEVRTLL